jgi:hypothetical protein
MIPGTTNDFFLILFLYIFASYIYIKNAAIILPISDDRVSEIKLTLRSYN